MNAAESFRGMSYINVCILAACPCSESIFQPFPRGSLELRLLDKYPVKHVGNTGSVGLGNCLPRCLDDEAFGFLSCSVQLRFICAPVQDPAPFSSKALAYIRLDLTLT